MVETLDEGAELVVELSPADEDEDTEEEDTVEETVELVDDGDDDGLVELELVDVVEPALLVDDERVVDCPEVELELTM